MASLVIEVYVHDGRFHGLDSERRAEWPPSPARLFQAFIAGAARGSRLDPEDQDALTWLEELELPPVIATPVMHKGQSFSHFMPNNDLDVKGGDPHRIGEIRSATKRFHPRIFDPAIPFLYIWSFDDGKEYADRICHIADQIYQLGRGVDMAWAMGEILDTIEAEEYLHAYRGTVYRPAKYGSGHMLACLQRGSLRSLIVRHQAGCKRFKPTLASGSHKNSSQTFLQLPKPRFRQVAYASPPKWLLYELRDGTARNGFYAWPLVETTRLVEMIRNRTAEHLEAKYRDARSDKAGMVKRVFGLCCDATEADKASRIHIIPLPSIGHPHADHAIRRLMVEIPPNCPLPTEDVAWIFSTFSICDNKTGEIRWMLVTASQGDMLRHYGVSDEEQGDFQVWRTVSPAALQIPRAHGRNNGSQRADVERRVAGSVMQALRHAGVRQEPETIRVQREPFDAKGLRAEAFATGTRFASAQFWHVEITFVGPVPGPLLIGNGRYLGFGLMRPLESFNGVWSFAITPALDKRTNPTELARDLRRAIMSRVQATLGFRKKMPVFFSGHEPNGRPAQSGIHKHLSYIADIPRSRLLIVAPHLLERRQPEGKERNYVNLLDKALKDFYELRAGHVGKLVLRPNSVDLGNDPFFMCGTEWRSITRYQPTRYAKRSSADESIIADIRSELKKRGLPDADIELEKIERGIRGGLSAQVHLRFKRVVSGLIMIGKSCHFGGGLFMVEKKYKSIQ
jgi:CRISPR-associated protein Csb2